MQVLGNQVVEVKNNQWHKTVNDKGVFVKTGLKIAGTVEVYANILKNHILLKRDNKGNKIKPIKQPYSTKQELNNILSLYGVSVE